MIYCFFTLSVLSRIAIISLFSYVLIFVCYRANLGIFCSTPGIPLVRNVPRKSAMYMLFTGLPVSGREAYECGLVSKVVPNDKLGERTKNY